MSAARAKLSAKLSTLEKAQAAWGADMPHWVRRLAEACDAAGLNKTAARLQISPALLSLTINKRHHAGYAYAQTCVQRLLMTPDVACPVLGLISAEQCSAEQQKPFTSVNPLAVAVYRACRACEHCVAANKETTHAA